MTRIAITVLSCALAACSTSAPATPGDAATAPPAVGLELLHKEAGGDTWTPATTGFWGDPIDLRVTGVLPGIAVNITATTAHYHASATFIANASGVVDLATTAPETGGTYSGVDVDGLLWSATTTDASSNTADYPVTFQVEVPGTAPANVVYQRWISAPGSKMVNVMERGLVGVMAVPAGVGPHPAIIVLGGSDGGITWAAGTAAYYASMGYVCLGLAYFDEPGLPSTLSHIPLEYFTKAIGWLNARPEVVADHIGVLGTSRGGELALLLAATYPALKAVVAMAPSGYVWGGGATNSAWTLMGKEVTYVPSSGAGPTVTMDSQGRSVESYAPAFLADLNAASPAAVAAATIEVEKVNGPVLVLGGADDQLWASCTLSKVVADRLAGRQPSRADQVVCYPETGHFIFVPGIPTGGQSESYQANSNTWLAIGGTPAGTAHAARDADGKIRAFLSAALR